MDLLQLNLPPDVRPEWDKKTGVPNCPMGTDCPSYDGKRCGVMGMRPGTICEPAVEAMARAIPGLLEGA